jgi:hypothetical protein
MRVPFRSAAAEQRAWSPRRPTPGEGFGAAEIFPAEHPFRPSGRPQPQRRASCAPPDERTKTMQRVTLVRYAVKPNRAAENETLARAVFAELRAAAPDHVAYALFRDGVEFVHVFINTQADDSSPVTELPSFKTYVKDIVERCEAPPEQTRLSVRLLDSYGLTRAMARA